GSPPPSPASRRGRSPTGRAPCACRDWNRSSWWRDGDGMTDKIAALLKDPEHARTYAERPRKTIPGFDGLHRIMAQRIAEASPADTLVVGGGGGLELQTLIRALPDGRFCAVDPSAEMIAQGKAYLGDPPCVDWVQGYVFDAP